MTTSLRPDVVRDINNYLEINQRIPNWQDMVLALYGYAYFQYLKLDPEEKESLLAQENSLTIPFNHQYFT